MASYNRIRIWKIQNNLLVPLLQVRGAWTLHQLKEDVHFLLKGVCWKDVMKHLHRRDALGTH